MTEGISDKDKTISLLQSKLKEKESELDQLYRLLAKLNSFVKNITQDTQKGIDSAMSLHRKLATKKLPKLKNLSFASRYIMSRGDLHSYFDIFPLPKNDGAGLVVCEAKGYGTSSVLMSMVMNLIETPYANSPKSFVKNLMDDMKEHAGVEDGLHVFYAVIEKKALNMKFCSLGMPASLLLRDNEVRDIKPASSNYEDSEHKLKPGDKLVVLNNAVFNAKNPSDTAFSQDGLSRALTETQHLPIADIVSNIGFELDIFTDSDSSKLMGDVVILGLELERNILYLV